MHKHRDILGSRAAFTLRLLHENQPKPFPPAGRSDLRITRRIMEYAAAAKSAALIIESHY
jgi:hypothetical protein